MFVGNKKIKEEFGKGLTKVSGEQEANLGLVYEGLETKGMGTGRRYGYPEDGGRAPSGKSCQVMEGEGKGGCYEGCMEHR